MKIANINNQIIETWLIEVFKLNNIPCVIPSVQIVYLKNNPIYVQYNNKTLEPRFDDWLKSTGAYKYYFKE